MEQGDHFTNLSLSSKMEEEEDYFTNLPLSFFGTPQNNDIIGLLNLLTLEEQRQYLRPLNKTIRHRIDEQITEITCEPTELNLSLLAKGAAQGRWSSLTTLNLRPSTTSTDTKAVRLGKYGVQYLITILQNCSSTLKHIELLGVKIGNIELNILLKHYEEKPFAQAVETIKVHYDLLISKGGSSSANKFFSVVHSCFPNLRELYVDNVEKTKGYALLPQSLGLLRNLEKLTLHYFPFITELNLLSTLSNLKELNIIKSTLVNTLPFCLLKMTSLKSLTLTNNDYPQTTEEYQRHPMPELKHFDYLSCLPQLESLNIECYHISSLDTPDFLFSATGLKHLRISKCIVDILPDVLPFPQLITLELSSCEFEDVPELFASQLNELTHLSFRDCKDLLVLPESFFSDQSRLPSLKSFDLKGCLSLDNLPFNLLKREIIVQLTDVDFDGLDFDVLYDFYEASKYFDHEGILDEYDGGDIPPLMRELFKIEEVLGGREDVVEVEESDGDNGSNGGGDGNDDNTD